jgi:hypothetical protein
MGFPAGVGYARQAAEWADYWKGLLMLGPAMGQAPKTTGVQRTLTSGVSSTSYIDLVNISTGPGYLFMLGNRDVSVTDMDFRITIDSTQVAEITNVDPTHWAIGTYYSDNDPAKSGNGSRFMPFREDLQVEMKKSDSTTGFNYAWVLYVLHTWE